MKNFFQRIISAIMAFWISVFGFFGLKEETPAPSAEPEATAVVQEVLSPAGDAQFAAGGDKIHFLNTGNSDAILLESDGHFAMVDSGEDTDNPRGFPGLNLEGFEEKVLSYLKEHAADKNGKVHLDFVLGTHAHSDHIGGFDTILADPDVTVDRAYLKVYDSSKISQYEIDAWDNQEVYDQMIAALQARNIPVISNMDATPFRLGNFTLTLFNTDDPASEAKVGENDQSVGMLIEKNGTRIFLGADMEDATGDLTRAAAQIGKVDLLKMCHHGIDGNNPSFFLEALRPRICVVTSWEGDHNSETAKRVREICDPQIYYTGIEDGVLAVIGDGGEITCYNHIHTNTEGVHS